MSLAEKFIVVPFTEKRKRLSMGEMRQSSSAQAAEKLALAMSSRFVGVAAYAVKVDTESGDMMEPKLITKFGSTIDIMADA
ncbi:MULTISPECIES: hypothetical protein [Brucella]|uniref:hypothetical protein n=1 Tax=Brucella TaxID=234 RepID=UPI000870EB91|nr:MULTISPECIES: hypothetical protein [Brucella]RRY09043.1 hypothetical protein EGJ58_14305 [Brucella anthropi]SCD23664.1 hypothetical protein BR141012304_11245 [Brucella inopinata]